MVANQRKCSRLEQRSVIKFLVAEKYKPCKIYRRMCDTFGEGCFSVKKFYKSVKHEFSAMSQSGKTLTSKEDLECFLG